VFSGPWILWIGEKDRTDEQTEQAVCHSFRCFATDPHVRWRWQKNERLRGQGQGSLTQRCGLEPARGPPLPLDVAVAVAHMVVPGPGPWLPCKSQHAMLEWKTFPRLQHPASSSLCIYFSIATDDIYKQAGRNKDRSCSQQTTFGRSPPGFRMQSSPPGSRFGFSKRSEWAPAASSYGRWKLIYTWSLGLPPSIDHGLQEL
jgi:hypothetical protein